MIERGVLEGTSLRLVRRVAAALGVSLPVDPRWRGADLATLLDERHAVLVQVVVAKLTTAGWQALPEHTFNEWGEKGSIDVLAWHDGRRALLSIEIKTRLPDLQDLLSTMDRKRRLAPMLRLAADRLRKRARAARRNLGAKRRGPLRSRVRSGPSGEDGRSAPVAETAGPRSSRHLVSAQ
jgi:Holliday junction resolvase-like predicted endonuclease